MANSVTDMAWKRLLNVADPSDPSDVAPGLLRDMIDTAVVSSGDARKAWVLVGTLKDGRHISCRATSAGIHAMSISTVKSAVDSDLQRFKVAERVGLPKGSPRPLAVKGIK